MRAGHVHREQQGRKQQQGGDEIRGTRKVESVLRRDGDCENLRKERRPGHASDGAEGVDGALKLAL